MFDPEKIARSSKKIADNVERRENKELDQKKVELQEAWQKLYELDQWHSEPDGEIKNKYDALHARYIKTDFNDPEDHDEKKFDTREDLRNVMLDMILKEYYLPDHDQIIQMGESEKFFKHFAEKLPYFSAEEIEEKVEGGSTFPDLIQEARERHEEAGKALGNL